MHIARAVGIAHQPSSSHHVKYLSVWRHCRLLSTSLTLLKKDQLPPRPTLPVEETFKAYLKGSGPGGQKINKTSSAVQLTHIPTGIVVKSQATRSRTQNETIARRILAEKVEQLEKGSESRVEKKRERMSKKKRSAEKKKRRKYRKLAEDKEGENHSGQGKLAEIAAGSAAGIVKEAKACDIEEGALCDEIVGEDGWGENGEEDDGEEVEVEDDGECSDHARYSHNVREKHDETFDRIEKSRSNLRNSVR